MTATENTEDIKKFVDYIKEGVIIEPYKPDYCVSIKPKSDDCFKITLKNGKIFSFNFGGTFTDKKFPDEFFQLVNKYITSYMEKHPLQ